MYMHTNLQTHVKEGEAVADEKTVLARRDARCIRDADEVFLQTQKGQSKQGKKKVQF